MRLFSGSQLAASVDAACPAAQAWTVDVRLYSSPLPRQQRLRLPRRQPGTRGSSRGFGSGRERLPSPLAAPCEARTLRASLFLQVATGSLVGSAVVRNMGRTPLGCENSVRATEIVHLQGMIASSHPYAVDAAAALCRRRRLRESSPTCRETPHSKRCAITLSMMPYSFASSAVMK
jgi:hypothetical protein